MVVTYKAARSNSNDSDECSWTWNVSASVNTISHCIKMLFHVKNRQVFLAYPVFGTYRFILD
jgi:hypothetical protein